MPVASSPNVEPAVDCAEDGGSPCQGCGACCAYSRDWPRFTTEEDREVERIPAALRRERPGEQPWWGMRCVGDRCAALSGEIGVATACTIYDIRPEVCRACEPGDDACTMARRRFGLHDLTGNAPGDPGGDPGGDPLTVAAP